MKLPTAGELGRLRDDLSAVLMEDNNKSGADRIMNLIAHWTVLIAMAETGMLVANVPEAEREKIRRHARSAADIWFLQHDLAKEAE